LGKFVVLASFNLQLCDLKY